MGSLLSCTALRLYMHVHQACPLRVTCVLHTGCNAYLLVSAEFSKSQFVMASDAVSLFSMLFLCVSTPYVWETNKTCSSSEQLTSWLVHTSTIKLYGH